MRTVLVTGVSTGIGNAIADELLKSNFLVIGSVRKIKDAEKLKKQYPDTFFPVKFDVTIKEEIENAKKEIKQILKNENTSLSC
ncbi:uncharacterized protein METZ01_LOCUS326084, partial [marine metagenome]